MSLNKINTTKDECIINKVKSNYLYKRNDLQGDCGQIQGVHHKVHEIPPVVDVILQAAVPHLLNLSPYKTCNYREVHSKCDFQPNH